MPATVLIAAAEHLATLKEREELVDAVMFSDAEALRALDVITRQRPDIVLLDRQFAGTSRGAALINRIKADPSLGACEIRIVEDDRSYTHVASHRAEETSGLSSGGGSGASALVVEEMPSPPAAVLDQTGTRHAPRFKIVGGIEVEIDGNPATLVDLSVSGAQVVSATILKPNQRVRFIVPTTKPPIRLKAAVVWASFEIPQGLSRYRAGIQLFGADQAAMTRFIDRNKEAR
ncbi:MAG TPA: PilZ domain-containing protein [Vicinamibacterales bacterium]